MPGKRLYLLFIAFVFSACSSTVPPCSSSSPARGDVIYAVEGGWHVGLGIPVQELDGGLAFYRNIFPGARVIMFGYGKRTFITAPPDAISEYFLGPVPGPAVIQAVGLNVMPPDAYAPEDVVTLRLPPGGARALSHYIWNDLSKDAAGKPQEVARSNDPDGLFYAAESEYSLLHTCNTWAADALHEAGFPVSGDSVIFAGQVMTQVDTVAENQCGLVR